MNEITRIHIAKVAYDIEIGAKKELEKYIKSLESYTQDTEVLADIEIRITELLNERHVAANGVISSDDVAAIRKQLGEPYEFANEDGDIAIGATRESNESHRLYRSLDNAVLGGVLSGIAAYFKVNPLWTRLIFLLLTVISAGLAVVVYVVLWVIIPAARTAAEKLQLAGKPVTLESIRELNANEETSQRSVVAPIIRRALAVFFGAASLLAAISILVVSAILAISHDGVNILTNSYFGDGGDGGGEAWLARIVFWIVFTGMVLLAALFSVIAYALLAKKLTKQMIITGIVIIGLGLAAVVSVGVITVTQSARISSEAQAQLQTTKLNLPKDFSAVNSIIFDNPSKSPDATFYSAISSIQYVVDEGTPRYELTALPKAKVALKVEGQTAHITLDLPSDYRYGYVQPSLIIYGPALKGVETNGVQINYSNSGSQDALSVKLSKYAGNVSINGTFVSVVVEGKGSVDLSSSAVQSLEVYSNQELNVSAGTVRDLNVTQTDVCASTTYSGANQTVSVSGVTASTMTYNGKQVPATTYHSNCASVVVGDENNQE